MSHYVSIKRCFYFFIINAIRCVHQIDIITNKKERRMDHDFLLIHNLMFYEPFLLVLINGWPLKTPLEKSFLYTHHGWPCSLCCATAKPNIHWPPSHCRLGASWITLLFTSTLKECAKFKPNTNNVQFKILMMALLLRWPIKLTFILHTLCWNCKRREKKSCFSTGLPSSYCSTIALFF